jgi:hypothetical protein
MRLAITIVLALCATASADATVTLRGGAVWHDSGWPTGTPVLSIGRTQIVGKSEATTAKVPASRELARATISIDGRHPLSFFFELREGHHYFVSPDPCCFVVVTDPDDGLAESARCASLRTCPTGAVEVDHFLYRKPECGEAATCAPPALLRVRGTEIALEWEGSDAVAWTENYRAAPVGRAQPQHVVARRQGKNVWDGHLVLRHGARYTLDLANPGAVRVLVDEIE